MMKNRFEKLNKIRNNGKGFSLVELVVSVAVLSILSTILLHSFVTSNTVTGKAIRIGEATDATQNIQEAIESMSVSDFLTADASSLGKFFTIDSDDKKDVSTEDEEKDDNKTGIHEEYKSKTIKNIKTENYTFDAKITFSSGVGYYTLENNGEEVIDMSQSDGFYKINKTEQVVNYKEPDATFVQSYSPDENPDSVADERFLTKHSDCETITSKKRYVTIEIKGIDENGVEVTDKANVGKVKTVEMKVYWTYDYIYNKKANSKSSEVRTTNLTDTIEISSYIVSGLKNPTGENYARIYFMYFPCYSNEYLRNTSYRDTFEIYNTLDLNVRLVLVKQKAVANTDTGDTIDNTLLNTYENQYIFSMTEYHSSDYVKNFNTLTSASTFVTNAGVNLASGETFKNIKKNNSMNIASISYRIVGVISKNHYDHQRSLAEEINDGSLVDKSASNRIYSVKVEIFKHEDDQDFETDNAVYYSSFTTSKLV